GISLAALRYYSNSAMGCARRIHYWRFAPRDHLDTAADIRQHRQTRIGLLSGPPSLTDTAASHVALSGSKQARSNDRQLEPGHSGEHARERLGRRRLLLSQLQYLADVLSRPLFNGRTALRLSAQV